MVADEASSNTGIAPICPQANIFINGQLADVMHLENSPKEPLSSEIKDRERIEHRKNGEESG